MIGSFCFSFTSLNYQVLSNPIFGHVNLASTDLIRLYYLFFKMPYKLIHKSPDICFVES